jgi:inhibitor of KinA
MKYFVYSANSILITSNSAINTELIQVLSSIKKTIEIDYKEYLIDTVQSINSLLIIFDRKKISLDDFYVKVKSVQLVKTKNKLKSKIWEIPVCYDTFYASNLEEFSKSKNISKQEVIQIHKSKVYDIISMGFLPGFMYLGKTDNKLHCERKQSPSLNVKKGSIGLALNQTCIYPQDSPGGWHIIGSSPLNFFDIKYKDPCFASPGDKIKFIQISKSRYELIKKNKSIKPIFQIK